MSAAVAAVPLRRPAFLAVVSANSLATTLARKASGRVDGFIVEGPTAGGHNAPRRGAMQLDERGEPVYGARDAVDLAKLAELGLPYWLAGGTGTPEGLAAAIAAGAAGAAGVQVGTLFAFCEESGVDPALRQAALAEIDAATARVFTDPRASATGYPFKLLELTHTPQQDGARRRVCDLGYLRTAVRASTTAAPRSPWTTTWRRAGTPPTRWGAAASATACSPRSGTRSRERTAGRRGRCSRAATTCPACACSPSGAAPTRPRT